MITETTRWVMALCHPARRQILRVAREADPVDAALLAERLSLTRGKVDYHLAVLDDLGWLDATSAASAARRRGGSSPR